MNDLILILSLIVFVLIIVIVVKYVQKTSVAEKFTACYNNDKGNMSVLNNKTTTYLNMNNTGRLINGNIGPIKDFHKYFTNNEIPELNWSKNINSNINRYIVGLNGEKIQHNDNAVNNVYNFVKY